MPGTATGRFTEPETYVANLRAMAVEFVVTGPGRFDGRLTRAQLPHIDLLGARESLPRIAYVLLQPGSLFVSFLMQPGPAMLLNGMVLQPGEIAFHVGGERFHQRTTGVSRWGLLAMAPRFASIYAAALTGRQFRLPSAGQIFCPPAADAARFLRLHERICHLAETRPASIGHPEVARALEQKLIDVLMTCLCRSETRNEPIRIRRYAAILARLEHQMTVPANRLLPMRELCAIIGISQRTLEMCCTEFLAITPKRYFQLRRLNDVRAALLNADPDTARVNEIARSHNFTELGRFAASYQEVFGEMPSTTLRRVRNATAVGDVPLSTNPKPPAP